MNTSSPNVDSSIVGSERGTGTNKILVGLTVVIVHDSIGGAELSVPLTSYFFILVTTSRKSVYSQVVLPGPRSLTGFYFVGGRTRRPHASGAPVLLVEDGPGVCGSR